MPLVSRTRATLRSAEFGFFGVWVKTRTQTPRFCGLFCSAGLFVLLTIFLRPGANELTDSRHICNLEMRIIGLRIDVGFRIDRRCPIRNEPQSAIRDPHVRSRMSLQA